MVATIQCASSSKATSGLIVRNTFEPVKFGTTILDFGQKNQALNCIVDCGFCRHLPGAPR
jgi:hypothetical protein